MVKYGIKIYCRVKPAKGGRAGLLEIDEEGNDGPSISFTVPKELTDGYINNKKEVYSFRFDKVFDQQAKQEQVFEHVAQSVIDNVLVGYNGTIFAYGQTGSGKTYSITGGAEKYADRGIIPRTLSYIFELYEKNSEAVYTTHISYLEIYNENGYDLLDPKHEASKLEDLPKVSLMEDSDGNIHLKNLSLHQANNEEEALNWLFLGDTNRMIAETPMNQASTRSHCIFTIHISTRDPGSAVIRRAKLHLVDLAGSERVSKTNVGGTLLTEAKYINLSLHYLEQVIVALSEKSRSHIPYRNSMMTAVLRDSLGGNCMTSMIATCSIEKKNIDESISTCRFAQRVALIKNDAILNEEIDPKLMIARLKKEIQQLKAELALARGGVEYTGELTEEEMKRLKAMVLSYIEDNDQESTLEVGGDMTKIYYAFKLLKDHVLERKISSTNSARSNSASAEPIDSSYLANQTESKKLKDLIQQRDNEINILVGMLKKEKSRATEMEKSLRRGGGGPVSAGSMGTSYTSDGNDNDAISKYRSGSRTQVPQRPHSDTAQYREHAQADDDSNFSERGSSGRSFQDSAVADMSVGRKEAFEIFRRDYPNKQVIEENKITLKQRYAEAKSLGEQVNHSRQRINHLKAQIEQHRIRQSVQGLSGTEDVDPVEQQLRDSIENEKQRYKESFTRLKSLKTEIEHLQHLLEKSKVKLQKDFENWWVEQAAQLQANVQPPSHAKSAWRTPPLSPIRPMDKPPVRPPSASRKRDLFRASSQESLGSSNQTRNSSQTRNQPTHDGLTRGASLPNGLDENGQTNDKPSSRAKIGGIPLTGDSRADADIMAFVRARQNLLQHKGKR